MNNKKAILLIHGFAGTPSDFGELINNLTIHYDVFYFTLPNHNKKRITNVTRKEWLDRSEEELQKIINRGYKEIYLIGHSMGGVISVYLASKYKKITKLVLASPAYKYQNKKDFSIKEGFKLLKTYSIKKVIESLIKVPRKTFKEFLNLVIEHQEDIKNINCPTLILWGNLDKIVSENIVDYIYNNINSKSVSLIKISDVQHNLFINNRYKEIKNIILDFLSNENNSIKKETTQI